MAWPLASDFSRMLQNPRIAFRDPELQNCTIETNTLGQPKPRSGNFATVYRGVRPDGSPLALRVFNRRAEQRRQRYEAVSDYLSGRAIASFADFLYDEQGIRSGADGKLYPLIRMDWVPGVTLFQWARDACRARRSDVLACGAETWAELTRGLAAHRIVHGDLQPGNVLVDEDGRFTLVDYDCVAVPALMGQANLEVGLPAYQHPSRSADTALFPGLDNFSAFVIYVALRALAAEPSLWATFVDATGYDGLLFRGADFASSRPSPLGTRLRESPDEQVRDLAHDLFELLRYDLKDIRCIDEVLLRRESPGDVLGRRSQLRETTAEPVSEAATHEDSVAGPERLRLDSPPAPPAEGALAIVLDFSDSCESMTLAAERLSQLMTNLPRDWEVWCYRLSSGRSLPGTDGVRVAHIQDGSQRIADWLNDSGFRREGINGGSLVRPPLEAIETRRRHRVGLQLLTVVLTDGALLDFSPIAVPVDSPIIGIGPSREAAAGSRWDEVLPAQPFYTFDNDALDRVLK